MLTLRTAFASYPHAVALKDGRVTSDRVRFDFEEMPQITRAFRRMVRTLDFDLCEIALTTLAQAQAYGKPIVGLPVVLMRGFHHGALVCRQDSSDRGPARPGRQAHRRAGLFANHRHLAARHPAERLRRASRQRSPGSPPRMRMSWNTRTRRMSCACHRAPICSAMLMAGEIDAGIALAGLDPAQVRTVIPDADAAAADWYRRTGAYPVNHVVCVKTRAAASSMPGSRSN